MSRNDLVVYAFFVAVPVVAGIGAYQGGKAAVMLNPPPEQIVRHRVVALQPLVVHQDREVPVLVPQGGDIAAAAEPALKNASCPAPNCLTVLATPAAATSATIAETVTAAPAPAQTEAPTKQPAAAAAPPSHPRQEPPVYDALNIAVPGAATLNQGAPGTDPWEFRKNLGLGLRGSTSWNDSSPEYSATAYGYWEFLRIADTYFTGYGEINDDRNKKVQLDMQWRNR